MSDNLTEAEKAVMRDEKFKQWTLKKAVKERAIELLGKLDVKRGDDEQSYKEIAVALCAAQLIMGEEEKPKDKTAVQKTIKGTFYKWSTEHHSFSNVKLTREDLSKATGALKEMIVKSTDDATGEEQDVLESLKYYFNSIPKANEKMKPLTNDQQIQNNCYNREFSRTWRWALHEAKERAIEYATRLHLKKKGISEGSAKESSDKESSSKSAGDMSARSGSSRDNATALVGDISRYETFALQELSVNRLKAWIEEDEDKVEAQKREDAESKAIEGKKLHEQFVKVKDSLRIRMPSAEFCASEFPEAPKMGYGRELSGVKPKMWKGPQSTVDMMAGSGLKWVHATSKGRQGNEGDLERCRKQLLDKGFVSKSNFDMTDEEDVSKFKHELRNNERVQERKETKLKMKEASTKAFNDWVQQKDLKDQALKCLNFIRPPEANEKVNNRSTTRSSKEGSLVESRSNTKTSQVVSAQPPATLQDLLDAGRALKMVDRGVLADWAALCAPLIPFNQCAVLWDFFEPKACDVHNSSYSQVRESFLKLLRPGLDYKQVFKDTVIRRAEESGKDISELAEEERKAFQDEMKLNKRDMYLVLRKLGVSMKPVELRVLIDAFDENGDGVVSLAEFLAFVGPKRDKRGGSSLAFNQKCCWHTTCKVTGMPNAYSVSVVDRQTVQRKRAAIASGNTKSDLSARKSTDTPAVESVLEDEDPNLCEFIELNSGEFRMKVELRERRRRIDILNSFGVLDSKLSKSASKKSQNDGYDDDFGEESKNEPDEHGYSDDDFVNDKSTSKQDRCGFVTWAIEKRLEGLRWLYDFTKVAREEAELQYILTHGNVPKMVELTSATLDDRMVGKKTDALCNELLIKWKPATDDVVSFFSLEMGGQAGAGKSEVAYSEICRDPPDASADFVYYFWVKNLVPGGSYNFRIRGVNGYGPGEYTYKQFTTRPEAPCVPRVIFISSDAVTLRWIFSKGFNARMTELRKIFDAADIDHSGNVSRGELADILEERSGDNANRDYVSIGRELREFLKTVAAEFNVDTSLEGWCATLFDKIEGDDDNNLSWEEFQRFFLNCGWANTASVNVGASQELSVSQSMRSKVGDGVLVGSKKLVKCSYVVEQCDNELYNEFSEVVRTGSTAGKAQIKHLIPGKSYRYRVKGVNLDGVAGPPSETVVVHTLIDTPAPPTIALQNVSTGTIKQSTSTVNLSTEFSGKRLAVDATRVILSWKDRNSQLFNNSRDKRFVNKMIGDWAGSADADDAGARSVSIEAAFAYYDKDKSGAIDSSELALLLEDLGVDPTPDRISFAFSQLDTNHDGTISFEEFAAWWRGNEVSYTVKRSEIITAAEYQRSVSKSLLKPVPVPLPGVISLIPIQAAYPITSYRNGSATKTEIAGLIPNSMYQFVMRYTGSRSVSLLSQGLPIITAPLHLDKPLVLLATSNSVRIKMYPQKYGLYKFIVQLKQLGCTSLGGTNTLPVINFGLPTSPVTAAIDVDGWSSVYFGQETVYSCMTLASETEYSVRVFACNFQNILSAASPIATFRTEKRVVVSSEEEPKKELTTAALQTMNRGTAKTASALAKVTGDTKTVRTSFSSSMVRGKFAEPNFSIECRYDVCVGDTILFTERLYLKQKDRNMVVSHTGDAASTAGSVKSSRVVNGKQVVRVDMSQSGKDEGSTLGGATINLNHSNNNILLGERTIAVHVVRDNFRTLSVKGVLAKTNKLLSTMDEVSSSLTRVSLDALDARRMKLVKGRVLWLEVIWCSASNAECKKYEYKAGEIIERTQENLLNFEVFRTEWPDEDSRRSYESERVLLSDCFVEY